MQAVQKTFGSGEGLVRCDMCGRDSAAKHTITVSWDRWAFVFCFGCCNRYGGWSASVGDLGDLHGLWKA